MDLYYASLLLGAFSSGLCALFLMVFSKSKATFDVQIYVEHLLSMASCTAITIMYIILLFDETMLTREDGALVVWGRFIGYAVAFMFTAFHVTHALSLNNNNVVLSCYFSLHIFASFMLVLAATLSVYNVRWLYFTLALVIYAISLMALWSHLPPISAVHMSYLYWIKVQVAVVWSLYFVVWSLSDAGASVISQNATALSYTLLDILTFCSSNVYLCFKYRHHRTTTTTTTTSCNDSIDTRKKKKRVAVCSRCRYPLQTCVCKPVYESCNSDVPLRFD